MPQNLENRYHSGLLNADMLFAIIISVGSSVFNWALARNYLLDPDQSCASCGSTEILLIPLQQEVLARKPILTEPPKLIDLSTFRLMRQCRTGLNQYLLRWTCWHLQQRFGSNQSANMSLKHFKFQQEVMARQIRFFRGRHQQIRTVLEKLRSDIAELKRSNLKLHFPANAHEFLSPGQMRH